MGLAMESRIVQGTGVSVNSRNKEASLKIQRAMEDAIKQAHKEGITDPKIIHDRMRKAHIAAKGQ
jgi:hypothetical protein